MEPTWLPTWPQVAGLSHFGRPSHPLPPQPRRPSLSCAPNSGHFHMLLGCSLPAQGQSSPPSFERSQPPTHTAAQSLSVPHSASCLVCLRLTLEPPKSLSATCAGPEGFSVSQGSQASSLCLVVSPRTGPEPPVLVKGQTGQDREVGVMEPWSSVPASSARRLLVTPLSSLS